MNTELEEFKKVAKDINVTQQKQIDDLQKEVEELREKLKAIRDIIKLK